MKRRPLPTIFFDLIAFTLDHCSDLSKQAILIFMYLYLYLYVFSYLDQKKRGAMAGSHGSKL